MRSQVAPDRASLTIHRPVEITLIGMASTAPVHGDDAVVSG